MAEVELSIVMPCLNEERTLKKCIKDAQSFLRRKSIAGEILVVDNGSTDSSVKIAKQCGARVVKESRKGYGSALRAGFKAARGEYIIMGDCDRTYDFAHMTRMWKLMHSCDMVIGDRFKANLEPGAMSLSHRIGVRALSWLARRRFRSRVYDYHCGIRGMRRAAIEKLDFRTTGMEFATEMIALAELKGLKIKQLPVDYRKSVKGRRPKLNTVRDGFRHLDYILVGTMKPFWRDFWRLAGILLVSVLSGLGLLWLVSQIPREDIHENIQESVDYYMSFDNGEMKPFLKDDYGILAGGLYGTMMDFYADSIWLSIAYGYDGSMQSVVSSNCAWNEDVSMGRNLQSQLRGELDADVNYSRYWHGSLVLIRPLLKWFNAQQIYVINGVIIVGLILVIIAMLCKHREYGAAVAFVVAALAAGVPMMAVSFEFAQVFFVTGLISILAMRLVWKDKHKALPYLFFFSGILVNYLDFLTSETLALTIPLLLVLWLMRNKVMKARDFRFIIKIMLFWLAGYALMWLSKWLISWWVLGGDTWLAVGTQIEKRTISREGGFDRLEMLGYALDSNFSSLFPVCFDGVVGLLTLVVACVLILTAAKFARSKTDWLWLTAVVLVTIVPIVRYVVLLEHSVRHFFFAYRALMALVLGFLFVIMRVTDWRKLARCFRGGSARGDS